MMIHADVANENSILIKYFSFNDYFRFDKQNRKNFWEVKHPKRCIIHHIIRGKFYFFETKKKHSIRIILCLTI